MSSAFSIIIISELKGWNIVHAMSSVAALCGGQQNGSNQMYYFRIFKFLIRQSYFLWKIMSQQEKKIWRLSATISELVAFQGPAFFLELFQELEGIPVPVVAR